MQVNKPERTNQNKYLKLQSNHGTGWDGNICICTLPIISLPWSACLCYKMCVYLRSFAITTFRRNKIPDWATDIPFELNTNQKESTDSQATLIHYLLIAQIILLYLSKPETSRTLLIWRFSLSTLDPKFDVKEE